MPKIIATSFNEDAIENKLGNKKSVRFDEKLNKNDRTHFDDSNKTDLSEAEEDDNGNIIIRNSKKKHNLNLNENKMSNKMEYKMISQNKDTNTSMPQNPGLIRNVLKLFRQFRSNSNSPNINGECLSSSDLKSSASSNSIESNSNSNTSCIW